MADPQYRPMRQNPYESSPTTRKTVKFLTAMTIGASLLILSGLTLTGTVVALIMATPLLVLFSPILVPATITMLLIASGFLFSGGCGAVATTALTWMYRYVTGKHPIGADQLDEARRRIAGKAREYGHYVQQKAQEATQ